MISQSLRTIVLLGVTIGLVCGCNREERTYESSLPYKKSQNFLMYTGLDEDIFATGNSYFSLELAEIGYHAMGGKLTVNEFGLLCLKCGEQEFPFSPHISIPSDAQAVYMDHVGQVRIRSHDEVNILVGRVYCNFFEARRLPHDRFESILASQVPSQQCDFGESSAAFVLRGWAIQRE